MSCQLKALFTVRYKYPSFIGIPLWSKDMVHLDSMDVTGMHHATMTLDAI